MIYTNNNFTGHWPVGAAVVRADSQEQAAELLNTELRSRGFPADALVVEMKPFVAGHDVVRVLCDGNF